MKIKSLIGCDFDDVTVGKIYHVDEYDYGTAWIKDDVDDEYPMFKGEYEVVEE